MGTCLLYPDAESALTASHYRVITGEYFSPHFIFVSQTHDVALQTCENCGGDGGFAEEEAWVECPACGGSGWVRGCAEPLTLEDLDRRTT